MKNHSKKFLSYLCILLICCSLFSLTPSLFAEPVVLIDNSESLPTFILETDAQHPTALYWQLSRDEKFSKENILFEKIVKYSPTLQLQQTDLKEEIVYFIRVKVLESDNWSQWSSPLAFCNFEDEAYNRHQYVDQDVWNRVAPHFIPKEHPIKKKLDQLFSQSRVILNQKTMKKAGFINPKPRKWTHLIVTRHQDFPGYIFKIYLDAQRYYKNKPEYLHWLERIRGVLAIGRKIRKRGLTHAFKVPKKWIYPLPEYPCPPKEFIRKNFILVEEDMEILDKKDNRAMWKSEAVTKEILDNLYDILEEIGLYDCAKPANLPFSHDGRISFVDTQPIQKWPVLYNKLTPFLSPEMKAYWKKLTKKPKY